MKPLRLLMVTEPGVDGVFAIVDSIVRQIFRDHPQISVDLAFSSRRTGPALGELIREIERRDGRTIDLNVSNAPSPSDFRALWQLVRFTRHRGHQLVHAHSSKAGALARIARLMAPFPPVLYTPHAYYGLPKLGSRKEARFNLIERMLGQIGTSICCSEDERDFAADILKIPPDHLHVIHNGIDTARFAPADAETKSLARAELKLPAHGKILATIGRVSLQKNYSPLYAALGEMLPSADWMFSHAGAGSIALRADLIEQAACRCHNFEHLNDVAPLLQAADGFVMTSRYEGLSLAMLSAMSTGLPCFLPDAPGFHFLKQFAFDHIRWLPKPDDANSLKEPLTKALAIWAAQPSKILTDQRELVCQMFSESIQIGKLIALYQADIS